MAGVPRLGEGIEVPTPRGSEDDVVVALPSGRFLALSADAARFLRLVDGRRDLAELARLHAAERDRPFTPEAAERLIRTTFLPAGLIHFGQPPPDPGPPRSRLWLRLPLIPAGAASSLGRRLAPLFGRRSVVPGLVLAAGLHLAFYLSRPRLGLEGAGLGSEGWLPATALYLLGSIWHELGHVAALRRSGEAPGGIGLGMYYAVPVFHSDVSRAWLLSRRDRATVDLGGMYFQALFAGGLCAVYLVLGGAAWSKAILFTDLALLLNLNPFLRMDGYWLVADLTGSLDLRDSSLRRLRSPARGVPARAFRGLGIYAVASLVYLLALSAWMAVAVLPRAVTTLAGAGRGAPLPGLLFAVLVVAGTGVFLVRSAGLIYRFAAGPRAGSSDPLPEGRAAGR